MVTETISEMRSRLASQDVELAGLRERIAALEERVSESRRTVPVNLAALPPRPAPAPESQGVRIFHPADAPVIELPNDDELRRLSEVVLRKFPALAPDTSNPRWRHENVSEWNAIFRASFRRIASLNRDEDDRFDMRRSIYAYTAECEEWLRCHGMAMVVKWPPFFAAAIAAGDIAFCLDGGPHVALRLDGLGRRPLPAWRAVLDGRVRAPSPPPAR
jgi:hypothetical protein